jgi:ceramide glucosyltransferase
MIWLALLLAGLALAGTVTSLLAARAVRRLAAQAVRRLAAPAGPALPASVLKPLHGTQPGQVATLASTLRQQHAAPYEALFALPTAADPAAADARAAMALAPATPARLVVDGRLHGPNRKVCQLINLAPLAAHPVLVVADADMRVPPNWLTTVTASLAEPGVGLVTCLYRGTAAEPGLWSRLAGLGIDWHFLPNAALGESLGKAYGCYGATMALRAETLERLGGFHALVGLLADDHALGAAVRRLGLAVKVAPVVPEHMMAEPSLAALAAHELRWARTLRLLNPAGYLGLGLAHPLVPALGCALLAPWGGTVLALVLAARGWLAWSVDRAFAIPGGWRRFLLLPLRDALSFAIWGAGLTRATVTWQGRRYRMRPDGSMVEAWLSRDHPKR